MLLRSPLLFIIMSTVSLLAVVGCSSVGTPRQATGSLTPPPVLPEDTAHPTDVVTSTIPALPSPMATQLVESTIPAQPSPTATASGAVTPEEEATPVPTATASPTVTPGVTSTAVTAAPRATPGVVVTSEPRVDVWTYGTGVVSAQIQGPLQMTIGFLNALIVDDSGSSSLSYLDTALHAAATADPADGLVLGIETGYIAFEVNWLGSSNGGSQVEAVLLYENDAQAAHLVDLRRSGDQWYIMRVSAR